MRKMVRLSIMSTSAITMLLLVVADAAAQKNQDRLPSSGSSGLPAGVTSRPAREGEFSGGGKAGPKGDRWGSSGSGKQDRLAPSPTRSSQPSSGVRTATGYGYGRSTTPKTQDRLQPDRNYNGRGTVYRTIDPPVRTATGYGYGRSTTPKTQDRLRPQRNYRGPETIYRTINPPTTQYRTYVPQARPDLVGTPNYWNTRLMSFIWNNPGLSEPGYGKLSKYYDRYVNRVYRALTPSGQSFVAKTGPAIQRMVEEAIRRDPVRFAQLERDPGAFGRFMAHVHTRAYYESGWASLPISDQVKIGRAIDTRDLIGRDGRITTRDLIPGIFGHNPTRPAVRPIQAPSWPRYNQPRGVRGVTTDGRRYRF